MVNHPNRSKQNAIVTKLKALLRAASAEQIIDLASIRSAVAVFPRAREAVQIDSYFASDFPDGAIEQYWGEFGPRATLNLSIFDESLYELPLDWQDELESALESTALAGQWPVIEDLVIRGLGSKAEELRRQVLASDLAGAVEDALVEIHEREQ